MGEELPLSAFDSAASCCDGSFGDVAATCVLTGVVGLAVDAKGQCRALAQPDNAAMGINTMNIAELICFMDISLTF